MWEVRGVGGVGGDGCVVWDAYFKSWSSESVAISNI